MVVTFRRLQTFNINHASVAKAITGKSPGRCNAAGWIAPCQQWAKVVEALVGIWAMKKTWLFRVYRGWTTTQSYWDYNPPTRVGVTGRLSYAKSKRWVVIRTKAPHPNPPIPNPKSKSPIQIPQSTIQNPNPPSKSPTQIPRPSKSTIQTPHPNPQARFRPRAAENWAPISGGRFCWKTSSDFRPRVVEIGAQFPEKLRRAAETVRSTLRGADHVCLIANIAWHRPYVQMQETSTSHGIVDYCNPWSNATFWMRGGSFTITPLRPWASMRMRYFSGSAADRR